MATNVRTEQIKFSHTLIRPRLEIIAPFSSYPYDRQPRKLTDTISGTYSGSSHSCYTTYEHVCQFSVWGVDFYISPTYYKYYEMLDPIRIDKTLESVTFLSEGDNGYFDQIYRGSQQLVS